MVPLDMTYIDSRVHTQELPRGTYTSWGSIFIVVSCDDLMHTKCYMCIVCSIDQVQYYFSYHTMRNSIGLDQWYKQYACSKIAE